MTGDAQVPDEVVERLAAIIAPDIRLPHNREAWTDEEQAAYHAGRSFTEGGEAAERVRAGSVVRALVAHLRANPEDAAAVLGGRIKRRHVHDGWQEAPDGELYEIPARDQCRVIGPWTEEPTS